MGSQMLGGQQQAQLGSPQQRQVQMGNRARMTFLLRLWG